VAPYGLLELRGDTSDNDKNEDYFAMFFYVDTLDVVEKNFFVNVDCTNEVIVEPEECPFG